MDGHYEKMGPMAQWLKKRPPDYFMEQCYLSLDPDERTIAAMCDLGLDRNILWGSDFPHFDCTYPGVVKQVEDAMKILPATARHNIMTANPARFYRIDA
jgi:predicted TIM-barrel fold metal-dependent hydrolase